MVLTVVSGAPGFSAGGEGDEGRPDSGWTASVRDGIRFEHPGTAFRLHLGALIALDGLLYDDRNVRDSGLRLERILLRADGSVLGDLEFHADLDLKGIDTRYGFDQAWLSYEHSAALRFTAGLLEVPLTVEHSIPEEALPFVGYSFPAFLGGRTDLAIRVDGEVGEGVFAYDLTLSAGEGFDLFGQIRDEPQASIRLMSYPLRPTGIPVLGGGFLSGSLAYSPSFRGHLDVATPLRNKLFVLPRLRADAARFYSLGWGLDGGPFRIIQEVVRGGLVDLQTPTGEQSLRDQITAWQATLSVLLTGGSYDSRLFHQRDLLGARERPEHAGQEVFGPGALEVAARYSNGDIDREFFNLGLTNFQTSSQEFRTFTGALNWYPTPNLRFTAEVVRTIADQFPAVFDSHGRDTSFVFRARWRF